MATDLQQRAVEAFECSVERQEERHRSIEMAADFNARIRAAEALERVTGEASAACEWHPIGTFDDLTGYSDYLLWHRDGLRFSYRQVDDSARVLELVFTCGRCGRDDREPITTLERLGQVILASSRIRQQHRGHVCGRCRA